MTLTQNLDTLSNSNSHLNPNTYTTSPTRPEDSYSRNIKRTHMSSKHPAYKGVKKRSWGKWVSEIREPRKKSRIWLGSYSTVEMAGAHDVAVLSIKGKYAFLNFPELANLLPRPVSLAPREVQAAAAKAAYMHHLDSQQVHSSSSSNSLVSDINLTSESNELSEFVELPSLEESFKSSRLSSSFALVDSVDWWTCFPPSLQSSDQECASTMDSFEDLIWNLH